MKRERLTVDIVEEIVSSLDFTSEVLSYTYDAVTDQTTISACNIYHLRDRMEITFEYPTFPNQTFTVLNWDRSNKSFLPYNHSTDEFIVSGNVEQTIGVDTETPVLFTLPALHYYHSTPTAWNNYISNIREANAKFPSFYLQQVFRERRNGANNGIRREADLVCYLVDNQALEEFNTDERYLSRIEGLKKAYAVFENTVRFSEKFVNYDEVMTDFERPKFGIFTPNKGHTKGKTNTRADAIEIQFTLKMKPSCLICKDGCDQC